MRRSGRWIWPLALLVLWWARARRGAGPAEAGLPVTSWWVSEVTGEVRWAPGITAPGAGFRPMRAEEWGEAG